MTTSLPVQGGAVMGIIIGIIVGVILWAILRGLMEAIAETAGPGGCLVVIIVIALFILIAVSS